MMDVDTTFVSDGEPSEAIDPGETSFDDPSMAPKFLGCVLASAGDARLDIAAFAGIAAASVIVGFVSVQLAWAAARAAAFAGDSGDGVDQLLEWYAVMDVGTGQQKGERNALGIRREVAFCARPASICWIRPRRSAPFLAAMEEESTQARFQSMRSASRSRRNNSWCNRVHTPASCQSRNRRQHVTPEPQPISRGSISHGMPDRNTNRMPVSAARDDTRGRPPLGFGGSGGNNGSTINHSKSGSRGEAITPHESHNPSRARGFERDSKYKNPLCVCRVYSKGAA
jgi:hypothetical protein